MAEQKSPERGGIWESNFGFWGGHFFLRGSPVGHFAGLSLASVLPAKSPAKGTEHAYQDSHGIYD